MLCLKWAGSVALGYDGNHLVIFSEVSILGYLGDCRGFFWDRAVETGSYSIALEGMEFSI